MIGKSIICCKNTTSMLYHVMLNQNKRFKRFKVPSCTFKVNLKGPPHSPTCNFYDNITILLIRYDRLIYNSFVSCNSHFFLSMYKIRLLTPSHVFGKIRTSVDKKSNYFQKLLFLWFFFFKWAPIYIKFKVVSAYMYW